MASYLLDTHTLLWIVTSPSRVPQITREILRDQSNNLLISAVSAMELATKLRLGKLPAAEPLVLGWKDMVGRLDATELPLLSQHALVAGSLNWQHKDPFDRMLAAQAILLGVPLVTRDPVMATLPGLDVMWR